MSNLTPYRILYFVSVASLAAFLGISYDVTMFKYVAAFLQYYIFLYSLKIIYRKIDLIAFPNIFLILILFFVIPFIRIILSVSFELKSITDAFFLQAAYYQLPVVALALSLLIVGRGLTIESILIPYSKTFMPVALIVVAVGVVYVDSELTGFQLAYSAYENILIPVALLALYHRDRSSSFVGWLAILLLLTSSSLQGSRSYFLVAVYFVFATLVVAWRSKSRDGSRWVLPILLCILFISLKLLNLDFGFQQNNLVREKFEADSFMDAVGKFMVDYDFSELYFWSGNSRADILIDAFFDFELFDWLFGRGINATYMSFVERSTIELGWAQETFRWGLMYTIPFLIYMLKGVFAADETKLDIGVLKLLIAIKFLDGFVYGMPTFDVYNLLVFFALLYPILLGYRGLSTK